MSLEAEVPVHSRSVPGSDPAGRSGVPFAVAAHRGGAAAALAGFVLLLSRYRGEDEVEVELRTADGATPLRLELGANPRAGDFTARVADALPWAVSRAVALLEGRDPPAD